MTVKSHENTQLDPKNPFAQPSSLPLELPNFAAVKVADFEPALKAGMQEQRAAWEAIATDENAPTIENTLDAAEASGQLLNRVLTVLYALVSATDSPELDELEEKFSPELTAHFDAFNLDPRMYARFKQLDEAIKADRRSASAEAARVVELQVEEFERAGVNLTGEDADELRKLNGQITALQAKFSSLATKAMQAAGTSNFSLTPQLADLEDHDARVALLEKSLSRGFSGEFDTRSIVLELAKLRAKRAQLLGFKHHASIVAAASAAKTTENVDGLLSQLAQPAMANARKEAENLGRRMAAEVGDTPAFTTADWPRYEEAERKALFGVDDKTLAPYLELNNVIEKGVFFAANRLYGLTFNERPDLVQYLYSPDMRVWEVKEENGDLLGLFVGDYYARTGKRGGAWMNALVKQSGLLDHKPVIINCLNLTKPESGPTLLSWDNVITAFHEFGHALHGLLSDCRYPAVSGTSVPRDVVEFPSQVNEQWSLHPEVLANYALHVETGEKLPAELAKQLRSQGAFGEGYATTEYLGSALLDQAWHTLKLADVPTEVDQVEAFEKAALKAVGIDDSLVPPRYRTTYFNHVFGGGYDAAYYAYIWSEVMDADTVAWFQTVGEGATEVDGENDLGLNRSAGQRFREELLSRGNSRDPLESYKAYRGREPELQPLLKRRGLA